MGSMDLSKRSLNLSSDSSMRFMAKWNSWGLQNFFDKLPPTRHEEKLHSLRNYFKDIKELLPSGMFDHAGGRIPCGNFDDLTSDEIPYVVPTLQIVILVPVSLLLMTPGINNACYLIIRQEGDNSMSLGF